MNQLLEFFNNLNKQQRAVVIGGFSILIIFLFALVLYSNAKSEENKNSYTIATGLTKSEVMNATQELESAAIPFAIIGTGNSLTLRTTKEYINLAKIKLVTSQTANDKKSGWEIFDKSSLGSTSFENQIKYLRALEGELARSLESLSSVVSARVKVALPKESVFVEQKKVPTASAVLAIRSGHYLTKKQIEGIKEFIASSVPSMEASGIKLINQDGDLLENKEDEYSETKFMQQERYKKRLEKSFADKIISLLEPVVGNDRVVATVSVALDFTKKDIQEEIYDPEGVIRSEQSEELSTNSAVEKAQPSGVPGVQSVNQQPKSSSDKENSKKESTKSVVNYEISKKIVHERNGAYAQIKNISSAVTFDSSVLEGKDEKLFHESIEALVKDAIGFNEKRQDQVTVKSFSFVKPQMLSAEESGEGDSMMQVKSIIDEFIEYFKYIIVALLLFYFYRKYVKEDALRNLGTATEENKASSSLSSYTSNANEYAKEKEIMANKSEDLRRKVESELDAIGGMDEESKVKIDTMKQELEKSITEQPEDMAKLIELLLEEHIDVRAIKKQQERGRE